MSEPFSLTAVEAAHEISAGSLSCEELARSCLDRISACDETVQAFAHVATDEALARARDLDKTGSGGALRGIPAAIKDMIDTADMPTAYNSPIYEGFRPARDAACVGVLRARDAVVLGKVSTVEFASLGRLPPTSNPHHPGHTPGGSSAGSAAAVAAGMVPLALGTPDRRLADPAGGVLRYFRHETELRSDQHRGHQGLLPSRSTPSGTWRAGSRTWNSCPPRSA